MKRLSLILGGLVTTGGCLLVTREDGAVWTAERAMPCGTKPGPAGVRVDAGFCIDSTEVTVADFAGFLATNPSASSSGLSPACADAGAFTPYNWFYQESDEPVTAVSWCAAYAYCAWAGKRLCGAMDAGALRIGAAESDAVIDEWSYACSGGGARRFPYGNALVQGACNGGTSALSPVGSYTRCEGGFAGIFDMSGNAWEWTNDCDGAGATCRARGGSYGYPDAESLSCASVYTDSVLKQNAVDIGFRCCSE